MINYIIDKCIDINLNKSKYDYKVFAFHEFFILFLNDFANFLYL
jgi:hypothetical protein